MKIENINFIIKEAGEEDIPLALNLRKKLFRDTGVPEEAFRDDLDSFLFQEYTNAYKNNNMIHFFAYDKENSRQPAAVAGILIKRDFPYYLFKPGYYGWIIDVYTEPEYRGRGLASKLLEFTEKWAVEKGISELKLISASKDARRIYERLGYRPTSEMSMNIGGEKTYNEYIAHENDLGP